MPMQPRIRPRPACDEIGHLEIRVTTLEENHADLDTRLKAVENISEDVSAIRGAIDKIGRQFRVWAPSIIAAAVSAGIVNGKLGAFLHALVTGGN